MIEFICTMIFLLCFGWIFDGIFKDAVRQARDIWHEDEEDDDVY